MASFKRSLDTRNGLTLITAVGAIAPGEMPDFCVTCKQEAHTPLQLWNLSRANWSTMPTYALLRDLERLRGIAENTLRTAFVLGNEVDYGLGRIIESYTEIQGFPGRYKPFRTLEDALGWVMAGDEESYDPAAACGF